ncbi:hypothetical protein TSH58p_17755 [Azospirillum sp. TSH58]|nr:hypothetical protein TSH58p_17755 [Azospirillum sp. TSH58]
MDAHWNELEQAGLTHDEIQRDPIQRVMWDETYRWSAEVDAAESVICSTPAATPAGILAKLEVWKQTSEALVAIACSSCRPSKTSAAGARRRRPGR